MKLELDAIRCSSVVKTYGTALVKCNHHLFDFDPSNNIVMIKCRYCKSYHAFSLKEPRLVLGDRVLT